jgi:hypothetical protein
MPTINQTNDFLEKLRELATITIEVEQDQTEVSGNAIATDDAEADAAVENEINERLNNGDVWAWAVVKVVASWSGFEGSDVLGACSYKDEAEFKEGGYYADMVETALAELVVSVENESDERSRALADAIGDDASAITLPAGMGGDNYDIGRSRSYRVMTEDEADTAWDEALDNYLEECVYPELPETLRGYFDDAKWKRDAKFDGRGHALNSYDGSEEEGTDPLTGEQFVIFRTN